MGRWLQKNYRVFWEDFLLAEMEEGRRRIKKYFMSVHLENYYWGSPWGSLFRIFSDFLFFILYISKSLFFIFQDLVCIFFSLANLATAVILTLVASQLNMFFVHPFLIDIEHVQFKYFNKRRSLLIKLHNMVYQLSFHKH